MPSRIKIKVGAIEVEYEGEEKFIKDELPGLIKAVAALHAKTGAVSPEAATTEETGSPTGTGGKAGVNKALLTTSTIAGKLSSKTGPGLVMAASAHLGLVKNKTQFTRSEISAEMKSATAFYNKNYGKNLTNILKTLVGSNQLNEIGTDTYALPEGEVSKMRTSLGL